MSEIIDSLKFDDRGLITVVTQDHITKEVLMMAFANREAVEKTLSTGKAHYWSRSRQKLWLKGETSGHFQYIKEIRIDCDKDTILLLVEQEGCACHTGNQSCFFSRVSGDSIEPVEK